MIDRAERLRRGHWVSALLLVLLAAALVFGGEPPSKNPPQPSPQTPAQEASQKSLTATDRRQIRERDRLLAQSDKLQADGKLPEATAAEEKALALERSVFGNEEMNAAILLLRMAKLHAAQEDFTAARKLGNESLAMATKLGGKDDWRAINARLALAYFDAVEKLDHPQRLELAQRDQLALKRSQLFRQGKYREALAPAQQALEIRRKLLGETDVGYVADLGNLASLYYALGDYPTAEPLYRKALEINKELIGERHPEYATSLNNLAGLLEALGEHAQAEPLYRQALAIHQEAYGENHSNCAIDMNNLAQLYVALGDYDRAEPLLLKSLDVRKATGGENHPDYASTLGNLAELYRLMADYQRAEPLYLRTLEIDKRTLGEKHPNYALALNNLAALYEQTKDFARAEPLLRQALEIDKQVFGEKHPRYAAGLNNLAELYARMGDARAELLYRRAMDIDKEILGESSVDVATELNNLGQLRLEMGDDAEAESLLRKAVSVARESAGELNPVYARSLNNLALLYDSTGKYADAEPLSRQALRLSRREMDLAAAVQSERQQLLMALENRRYLGCYLSIAVDAHKEAGEVYSEVLEWKGAVSAGQQAMRRLRTIVARDGSPEAAKRLDQLTIATRALSNLSLQAPKPGTARLHQLLLDQLSQRIEQLERSLADASRQYREQLRQRRRTPDDIRQSLPADAALVDLVEYKHYSPPKEKGQKATGELRLAAFVLRRDTPVVRIELGSAEPIWEAVLIWRVRNVGYPLTPNPSTRKAVDALLAAWKNEQKDADPGGKLRQWVWDKFQPYLKGAKTVLLSPDEVTALFPWGALPGMEPGTYLIEETAVAVVPIPRLLPELLAGGGPDAGKLPNEKPSLLLVGEVNFDADPGKAPAGMLAQSAPRSTPDGELFHWPSLPGTRAEIVTIADSFEQQFPDAELKKLRGDQPTKAAVERELASHRYLHLATHGFFAPPGLRSALAASPAKTGGTATPGAGTVLSGQDVAGYQPGLLSGLVLAGANQRAEKGKDDGILTALEVSQLDLGGVELVTLSACETGLGDSAGGEGLLGLQRAFQVAGARSVMATLWTIRDDASRSLMVDFYENLWKKKMTKAEALRQAQLSMLRDGVKRGMEFHENEAQNNPPASREGGNRGIEFQESQLPGKNHRLPPFYWAAFVLSGDWR